MCEAELLHPAPGPRLHRGHLVVAQVQGHEAGAAGARGPQRGQAAESIVGQVQPPERLEAAQLAGGEAAQAVLAEVEAAEVAEAGEGAGLDRGGVGLEAEVAEVVKPGEHAGGELAEDAAADGQLLQEGQRGEGGVLQLAGHLLAAHHGEAHRRVGDHTEICPLQPGIYRTQVAHKIVL